MAFSEASEILFRDIIYRDDYEDLLSMYGIGSSIRVSDSLNEIKKETGGAIEFSSLEKHPIFSKILGRFFYTKQGSLKLSKSIYRELSSLFNTNNEYYLKYSVDDFVLKGAYRKDNLAYNFMRNHSAILLSSPMLQLKDELLDLYFQDKIKVIEENTGLSTVVSSLIGSLVFDINPFISYKPEIVQADSEAVERFLEYKKLVQLNNREYYLTEDFTLNEIKVAKFLTTYQHLSKDDLRQLISYWNYKKDPREWNYPLYDLSNEFDEKEIGEVNFMLQLIYVAELLKNSNII